MPTLRFVLVATRDTTLVRALIAESDRSSVPIAVTTQLADVRFVLDHQPDVACLLDAEFARQCVTQCVSAGEVWAISARSLVGGDRSTTAYPRAARVASALTDLALLHALPTPDASDRSILGISVLAAELRDQVRRVAQYPDVSVLVSGATGTGKELVAETIHLLTHGAHEPFVAVNCAALPDHLVESELFGHEAGAFTGARQPRTGLMQAAGAGTLFLDEIGEMPLSLQSKLLRALETRSFRPVGGNRTIPLRARVVSATNRVSRGAPDAGLREDLYYRLAGFTVRLPSLRRRIIDVPVLARHFLRQFEKRYACGHTELTDEALDVLENHDWPGNCRELRTVLEHAAISTQDSRVRAPHVRVAIESRLTETVSSCPPPPASATRVTSAPAPARLEDMERQMIAHAMSECGGNVSRAAKRLGIPRSTLRDKVRRYGI